MVLEDDLQCLYSCSQAIGCALFGLPHAPPKNPMIFGGGLHVEESVRLAFLLASKGNQSLSLWRCKGNRRRAAASELQRERRGECVLRLFVRLRLWSLRPSACVRSSSSSWWPAGWRGLGGSLARRVVMCLSH